MGVMPDEQFNKYIDAAGPIIVDALQQVGVSTTLTDAKQGARGAGDRYRRLGVDVSLNTMVLSAVMERITKTQFDASTVLDPLAERITQAQEGLRR